MHEIHEVDHAGKPTKDMLDDLKRLHCHRNATATEWRVCRWKRGVFMGPNWMDGASTSFVGKIAEFIQVFITDVPGWQDQERLDNQLLCLRYHFSTVKTGGGPSSSCLNTQSRRWYNIYWAVLEIRRVAQDKPGGGRWRRVPTGGTVDLGLHDRHCTTS